MIFDEPKRDIRVVKKDFATISALMSVSGTASGHLEKRLISNNIGIHARVEVVQLDLNERSQNERLESEVSPELGDCVV